MTLAKGPYADMRQGQFRSLYYERSRKETLMSVLVIGRNGRALMPTTPRKARLLLKKGNSFCCMQASVYHPAIV